VQLAVRNTTATVATRAQAASKIKIKETVRHHRRQVIKEMQQRVPVLSHREKRRMRAPANVCANSTGAPSFAFAHLSTCSSSPWVARPDLRPDRWSSTLAPTFSAAATVGWATATPSNALVLWPAASAIQTFAASAGLVLSTDCTLLRGKTAGTTTYRWGGTRGS